MEWLKALLWNESVAHIILIYSFVIALGVALGKITLYRISLGITFILFVGIGVGHFGFRINHDVLDFVRDFGLILFVFTIGLQVGPGFFSSFKKGGLTLNMLAMSIVLLGAAIAILLHFITGLSMPMMVGILSGAVTNTPGLGAAQQALKQVISNNPSAEIPNIGLGYAVSYPFGVIGIILTMFFIRWVTKVNIPNELRLCNQLQNPDEALPERVSIEVNNPDIIGKKLSDLKQYLINDAIISRVMHQGDVFIPNPQTTLFEGDTVLMVAHKKDLPELIQLVGKVSNLDLVQASSKLMSKQVLVSNREVIGKTLGSLKLRTRYGIGITRVYRSGVEIVASYSLRLQMGDKLTVVGDEHSIDMVAQIVGNSLKRLHEPNLIPIFIGVLMGVVLGSIPFVIPGIPTPIKLGMAGGPLIVAILLSRYGYKFSLVSYTTPSANQMLREIGIALFLASVGIKAGEQFIPTLVSGDGFIWMGYGIFITLIPLVIVGLIARLFMKRNFFEICGLLSGSMTDPPALAFANSMASNEAPSVAYATVYPLVMFLRILIAQMLILIFS
jgi:putative transport protein